MNKLDKFVINKTLKKLVIYSLYTCMSAGLFVVFASYFSGFDIGEVLAYEASWSIIKGFIVFFISIFILEALTLYKKAYHIKKNTIYYPLFGAIVIITTFVLVILINSLNFEEKNNITCTEKINQNGDILIECDGYVYVFSKDIHVDTPIGSSTKRIFIQ